jgi:ATP-dependent DNA helicase RecG
LETALEASEATQENIKKTTLEHEKTTQETSKTTLENTKATLESTETTLEKAKDALLQLLRQHPQLTASALAQATGLTLDGVKYHLARLKRSGRLRRHGATKKGHWEVID